MLSPVTSAKLSDSVQPPWAGLLEHFYTRTNQPAPLLRPLDGDHVPQPYRALLVHSCDMTPTLEAYYRQPIALKVLSRELQDQSYSREVVLHRTDDLKPIEYGAIRIWLNHLPPLAARLVLEAQRPFGGILQSESIAHMSWPQAFFCTESEPHMESVLTLQRPGTLYGRRNVLVDGTRRLLAEVIEILAPISLPPGEVDTDGY